MKLLILLLLFPVNVFASMYSGNSCRVTTQKDSTITVTGTQFLAELKSRTCLTIQNHGASTIFIKLGSANTATELFSLAAGATWEPRIVPVNAIFIRVNAGSVTATILEGQ